MRYGTSLRIQWQEIKDYAAEVIPVIRKNAPNSVVIVGTPSWDQEVDKAAADPLKEKNVTYALHYYAATHKDYLRERARQAIDAGLPLFISECGSMEATGDDRSTMNHGTHGLTLPTATNSRC